MSVNIHIFIIYYGPSVYVFLDNIYNISPRSADLYRIPPQGVLTVNFHHQFAQYAYKKRFFHACTRRVTLFFFPRPTTRKKKKFEIYMARIRAQSSRSLYIYTSVTSFPCRFTRPRYSFIFSVFVA